MGFCFFNCITVIHNQYYYKENLKTHLEIPIPTAHKNSKKQSAFTFWRSTQLPPQVFSTSHVNQCPKPHFYPWLYLHIFNEKIKNLPKTRKTRKRHTACVIISDLWESRWRRRIRWLRRVVVAVGGRTYVIATVGGGGERAGFEVSDNEKTGKSGGKEYQNQPQWAHC